MYEKWSRFFDFPSNSVFFGHFEFYPNIPLSSPLSKLSKGWPSEDLACVILIFGFWHPYTHTQSPSIGLRAAKTFSNIVTPSVPHKKGPDP